MSDITHVRRADVLKDPTLMMVVEGLLKYDEGYVTATPEDIQHYFFYHETDTPIAMAGLCNYRGKWCLRACVVHPNHRGKRIQIQLIEARIDYLRTHTKADYVNVWVCPDNIHSNANLEERKFVMTGEKRDFHGKTCYKMRRFL